MPYDSSGSFTRSYNWTADAEAGIKIESARMDAEFDNFAAGMNQVMLRSGTIPWTSDVKMGGNKLIGLGNGTAISPAVQFLSDTTTGMYLDFAGSLGFSTSGVERVRINAVGATVTGDLTTTGNVLAANVLTPILTIDPTYYLNLSGPGAQIAFDANDFMVYDRVGNTFGFSIAGLGKVNIGDYGLAVAGIVQVNDAAYYMGSNPDPFINFDASDYIQYDRETNTWVFYVDGVPGAYISDGIIAADAIEVSQLNIGGGGYYLSFNGPNPQIVFDANDYMQYDRAGDLLTFFVAGAGKANISATGLAVYGNLQVNDVLFYLGSNPNPFINFDGNDYLQYDRTNDSYNFNIGSAVAAYIDIAGVHVAPGGAFKADTTAYFVVQSGNPYYTFDANDYLMYDRVSDTMHVFAHGINALQVSGTNVNVPTSISTPSLHIDANYYLGINGAGPYILFNSDGSYFQFDRAGQALTAYVNNVATIGLNGTGRAVIPKPILGLTASVPGSGGGAVPVPANASVQYAINVPGARPGDMVLVSSTTADARFDLVGHVSANDTVLYRVVNYTNVTFNTPSSWTVYVMVFPHG